MHSRLSHRSRVFLSILLALLPGFCPSGSAVTIEQIISREHPDYTNSAANLTIGRDGKVYLAGRSRGYNGFVLRVGMDGVERVGGDTGPAGWSNVTANAAGVMASANQHFTHSVIVYNRNFGPIGTVSDFVSWTPEFGEGPGYSDPARVEAGEQDFYAVDQFRDHILRISPEGKVVKTYTIPRDIDGVNGLTWDFRVDEKDQAFYVVGRTGRLRSVGFDGQLRWLSPVGISSPWDVDENGAACVIPSQGDTVTRIGPDGKKAGEFTLKMGDLKASLAQYPITGLRVYHNELLLKRSHPTEMFQRYTMGTGERLAVVETHHERLAATYPSDTWTAGQPTPFQIDYQGETRGAAPQWRVWARPVGAPSAQELKVAAGQVIGPADGGVYSIEIDPGVRPIPYTESDYRLRAWVQVRSPGAHGTVNVLTPANRVFYGRGEAIPFSVIVRSSPAQNPPAIDVRLLDGSQVLATGHAPVPPGGAPLQFMLPPSLTAALRPGSYVLTASAPGLTPAPQLLTIGPGMQHGGGMFRVEYGDYGTTYPEGSVWDAPEIVAGHLRRTEKLGFNMMVDRLGHPLQAGAFNLPNTPDTVSLNELKTRLAADPLGPAPEKAAPDSALLQTQAAYSSAGIHQMAILLGNDAGLPLGTGFDNRKPDVDAADVMRVTRLLQPYPSFRGWDWASNSWVFDQGALAQGADKAAYAAALKRARDTGQWDPILDTVSDRWLHYAVDAEDLFKKAMASVKPNLVTAMAAPFRNQYAYPPVTLNRVDESDLQAQWEQVALPYHAPFGVDFYKRPGKLAWGHPEIWNDSGTGEQILPTLFQMAMRGADGVGCSNNIPPWGYGPEDSRQSDTGIPSIYRAANGFFRQYGPWFTGLQNSDQVAIIADSRMYRIDEWPHEMPRHFSRVFEAYVSCLYAHHPASIVFSDDLTPESLLKYKAVLLVGQRVEMEPALKGALDRARVGGVALFADGTCRPELVQGLRPLNLSFDKIEQDPHQAGDDATYTRFPTLFEANLPPLRQALDAVTPPIVQVENPQIFASERRSEDGRYIFVVNDIIPAMDPARMYRVNLFVASRVPVRASVGLGSIPPGAAVYDVLALRHVLPVNGQVPVELSTLPVRLFAVLPRAIEWVTLHGPPTAQAGSLFTWSVTVQDASGKAIRAAVPIRLRLLSAAGDVLEERFLSAGSAGVTGQITALLNAGGTSQRLEAVELLSGKSARLTITVHPTQPIILLPVVAPLTAAGTTNTAPSPPTAPSATGLKFNGPWNFHPAEDNFGPHIRDMVVSGGVAVLNTMNWDTNLYALDLTTGQVRWRQRVGEYFAFAPEVVQGGVAVQGFDFNSAAGYHLYLLDAAGRPQRRFALYGLPSRLPHRFVASIFADHADNFVVPQDGGWAASAGGLGIALWNRSGKLLWTRDDWKTNRNFAHFNETASPHPDTPALAALDPGTLLAADRQTLTAYRAATGEKLWALDLPAAGDVRRVRISGDGRTCAALSAAEGGRVYIIRKAAGGVWSLINILPTGGDDLGLSPDGAAVAVVSGNALKVYDAAGGLQWMLPSDDNLRFPRFSADGRLVVSSVLGTVYVLDRTGTVLWERDMGSFAVPVWLPGGDLLLGGWMGNVVRLDSHYRERWHAHLQPANPVPPTAIVADVPTARVTSWTNAAPAPVPLTPNLLALKGAAIKFMKGGKSELAWQNNPALLVDGKPDVPAAPWISWSDVNWFAEGSPYNTLLFDLPGKASITGITLVEDPAHPASWLRDCYLEAWDAGKAQWQFIQPLLSDAPVHTHLFAHPVEASRLRLVLPFELPGSLRLGEIVLHGTMETPTS